MSGFFVGFLTGFFLVGFLCGFLCGFLWGLGLGFAHVVICAGGEEPSKRTLGGVSGHDWHSQYAKLSVQTSLH